MRFDLCGKWKFKAVDDQNFLPATVPGCQYLDLMDNGIIDDPFTGINETLCQWVHDKDFVYIKSFDISPDYLSAEHIDLVCCRLDTICDLYLNDIEIGHGENCHRPYTFSVKQHLKSGENELKIVFKSPKNYVLEKYAETPTPPNNNGMNGIVHIRKPQCHFGWDWGPVLTPVGISADIYLEFTGAKRLGELTVKVRKTDKGFSIFASADNADTLTVTCPDGKQIEVNKPCFEFVITDPELWWTYELSARDVQPLYTVTAKMAAENGEVFESHKKVGLRTIELNRNPDRYGHNFQFILNGVPVFAKGANYIPPDSFATRFNYEKLDKMLNAVRFSNMNMLRIWGGGYYANEMLLDECDRRGILIWHDFMFACQAYPFFIPEFTDNVLEEVKYNVTRISSHPCLAVWCGNNEIEESHYGWITMTKYINWTEKFFYHILPDAISKIDDITPYTPGSPIGSSHNKDIRADYIGDTHLWNVWHGLQPMTYYRHRMTRFCSEFGFESLPCFKTVKTYAKPDEYALDSKVQKLHQKCFSGNDKMLYYIATRFRLSDDIEELIYLSQVTQQECIADATEHWRRNKGRCNGSIYWQLNDCWQTCSWSSYDYFGEYKALQYKARHFNAPVSVSIEDGKKQIRMFVLNDLTTDQNVEVEYIIFSFDGSTSHSERVKLCLPALKNTVAFNVPTAKIDAHHQGIAVRLYQNGTIVMQKSHLLLKEKKLVLPRSEISVNKTIDGDILKIELSSPVYQRLVMLEDDSDQPFSDNFFDLLPGEVKTIEQPYTPGCDQIRIRSVADLKKAKRIKNFVASIKVFLSFKSISNYLYCCRIPKEYINKDYDE